MSNKDRLALGKAFQIRYSDFSNQPWKTKENKSVKLREAEKQVQVGARSRSADLSIFDECFRKITILGPPKWVHFGSGITIHCGPGCPRRSRDGLAARAATDAAAAAAWDGGAAERAH